MREAVIIEAVRTPIGKKGGKLNAWRPDDLAALTLAEVVRRAGIEPQDVDDVIMGCVTQIGEQGFNVARNAALIAGFPVEVTGTSVNRQCGSSQQAIHFAAQAIISGACDVVIAAGVESMTRVPMGSDAGLPGIEAGAPGTSPISPKLWDRYEIIPQGLSAEMVAERWELSRHELDEYSYNSHLRAGQAIREGRFESQILPVEIKVNGATELFKVDEGVRMNPSLEKMATLMPAFKTDGVITAGNSSQISDGAAALLLMGRDIAEKRGLKPRARIVAMALAGVDPTIMLTGPIPATGKVLKKAGLTLADIDLIEINEAFASVPLAWAREWHPDMNRVNVNGGAIALGHPLGCSGARLMTTLLHELERRGGRYGLQTMCIGFGQATATIIERI